MSLERLPLQFSFISNLPGHNPPGREEFRRMRGIGEGFRLCRTQADRASAPTRGERTDRLGIETDVGLATCWTRLISAFASSRARRDMQLV